MKTHEKKERKTRENFSNHIRMYQGEVGCLLKPFGVNRV